MKPSLSKLAAVLQHFFSEKTFGGRRAGRKPARFLDCRPRRAARIFGIAGVFACEIRANPGNLGRVLIIPCDALHERRRKTDRNEVQDRQVFCRRIRARGGDGGLADCDNRVGGGQLKCFKTALFTLSRCSPRRHGSLKCGFATCAGSRPTERRARGNSPGRGRRRWDCPRPESCAVWFCSRELRWRK